jgi:hypothetical protein
MSYEVVEVDKATLVKTASNQGERIFIPYPHCKVGKGVVKGYRVQGGENVRELGEYFVKAEAPKEN